MHRDGRDRRCGLLSVYEDAAGGSGGGYGHKAEAPAGKFEKSGYYTSDRCLDGTGGIYPYCQSERHMDECRGKGRDDIRNTDTAPDNKAGRSMYPLPEDFRLSLLSGEGAFL